MRVAPWVAIAGGITLIIAIVVGSTFARADDGERATDLVRPELTRSGLAQHRADFELSRNGVDQLYDEVFPAFAAQLGVSTDAFEQAVADQYPAIGKLQDPAVRADSFAFADGIVTNLERHERDFADADAIPVSGLPMTAGPVIAVVVGAVLILAGAWALLRRGIVPFAVIGVVGLTLVVGPLVTRFPQKAESAHRLLATLNVTPAIAAHTRDLLEGANDAMTGTEQRLYPDLASQLGESQQTLDAFITGHFPAVAQLRAQETTVFRRYERRVEIREGGLTVIPEAKKFPLRSVVWWTEALGALTVAAAALALVALRRRDTADPHMAPDAP